MAVRICVLDLSCISIDASIKTLFGSRERERLEGISNTSRRLESEAGLLALRKALGSKAFCDVVRDEHGRPHFEKNIGIDFNISHSGSLSVAAVCDGEEKRVGVDIELFKSERLEKLLRVADRFFSESEKELFCQSESVEEFYRVWTAKEAEAKLLGIGLAKALGIKKEPSRDFYKACFFLEHSDEKYVLTLCAESDSEPEVEFVLDDGIFVEPFSESDKNGHKRNS